MASNAENVEPSTGGRGVSTVLLVVGIALLVYGSALFVGFITWSPPGFVYLLAGVVMVAYGFMTMLRQTRRTG